MSHDPRTLKPGDSVAEWFDNTYVDAAVVRGGVQQQAMTFVRTQNYLDYGHGAGVAITTEVRNMPSEPFQTFFVEAAGVAVAFRNNGTSWAWDRDGLIVGTDALLHGTAGTYEQTTNEESWMPVPVPIVQMPALGAATVNNNPQPANTISTPAGFDPTNPAGLWSLLPTNGVDVPARSRTVPWVIEPRNEVLTYLGRSRSLTRVAAYDYALNLGTDVLRVRSRSRVELPEEVRLPVTVVQVDAVAPEVAQYGQNVRPPVSALQVEALAPLVQSLGVGPYLPVTTLQVSGLKPVVAPDGLGDPYWLNVTALVPFNDPTNSSFATIYADSGPVGILNFYGSAQITSGQPHSGSGVFSVTSLDLTGEAQTAIGTEFRLGADDFTIELWVKLFESVDYSFAGLFSFGGEIEMRIYQNQWQLKVAGGTTLLSSVSNLNQWQHIAVVRSGGMIRVYVNGLQIGTAVTDSTAYTDTTRVFRLGKTGTSTSLRAGIDDLRVTPGIARYLSNFPVPNGPWPQWEGMAQGVTEVVLPAVALTVAGVAPDAQASATVVSLPVTTLSVTGLRPVVAPNGLGDPYWLNVTVLVPFNTEAQSSRRAVIRGGAYPGGVLEDQYLILLGGATITTAAAFSGAGGLSLNYGWQDGYAIGNAFPFNLGTGDYTVEMWVQLFSSGPNTDIYTGINATAALFTFDGKPELYVHQQQWQLRLQGLITTLGPVTYDEYQHIALVRSAGAIRLYVNGAQVGPAIADAGEVNGIFSLGKGRQLNEATLSAAVDDLRVTPGIARYLSNFPVPNGPWPQWEGMAQGVTEVVLPVTALEVTALAPTVEDPGVVTLPATTLVTAGVAPTVEQAGVNVEPPATALSLTALSPVVTQAGASVALPAAALDLAGVAPTVAAAQATATDGILQAGVFLFPWEPLYLFEPD